MSRTSEPTSTAPVTASCGNFAWTVTDLTTSAEPDPEVFIITGDVLTLSVNTDNV